MSHAEAVHTLHPAAGATQALVGFVGGLRYAALLLVAQWAISSAWSYPPGTRSTVP